MESSVIRLKIDIEKLYRGIASKRVGEVYLQNLMCCTKYNLLNSPVPISLVYSICN